MISTGSFSNNEINSLTGISSSFRNGITHGNSVSAAISGNNNVNGVVPSSDNIYDKVRNSYQSPKFTNTNIQNDMLNGLSGSYHTSN